MQGPPEITGHLIDLIHQDERVAGAGLPQGIYDTSRHGSYIGSSVPAYFGFVPHASQRHPDIIPVQGLGNGSGN